VMPAAGITDGGDVIDIDAEAEVRSRHFLPSDHAPAICLPAGPVSSGIAAGKLDVKRSPARRAPPRPSPVAAQ
jgi:hypothetical protein